MWFHSSIKTWKIIPYSRSQVLNIAGAYLAEVVTLKVTPDYSHAPISKAPPSKYYIKMEQEITCTSSQCQKKHACKAEIDTLISNIYLCVCVCVLVCPVLLLIKCHMLTTLKCNWLLLTHLGLSWGIRGRGPGAGCCCGSLEIAFWGGWVYRGLAGP